MDWLAVLLAGAGAGFVNTVVGSGSLVSFPTLVALGLPPVSANVTNNLGLLFGSLSGTWGYREELRHQLGRLLRLTPLAILGAALGSWLLLWLPPEAFDAVVPVLIIVAVFLVLLKPWLTPSGGERGLVVAGLGVLLASVYGGYFGAAQGVLVIGVLGVSLSGTLQELNGVKNALVAAVNLVAACMFFVVAPQAISWRHAAVLAIGAIVGGQLGARVGRRLPPNAMRAVVVLVGIVALVVMLRD